MVVAVMVLVVVVVAAVVVVIYLLGTLTTGWPLKLHNKYKIYKVFNIKGVARVVQSKGILPGNLIPFKNKLVLLSASLSQLSEALGLTILVTLEAGKFVINFVAARGRAREPVSFV